MSEIVNCKRNYYQWDEEKLSDAEFESIEDVMRFDPLDHLVKTATSKTSLQETSVRGGDYWLMPELPLIRMLREGRRWEHGLKPIASNSIRIAVIFSMGKWQPFTSAVQCVTFRQ